MPSAPSPRPLSVLNLSLPVAMGYIPLGAVFGFAMMQVTTHWWLPIVASILIFAGAAQFMMVPLLAAQASFGTLALATLVVNLRHVFYGLSLLERLPEDRLARAYFIWTLTDENYAAVTCLPKETPQRQILALVALNHGWWVLGSALGAWLGQRMPTNLQGLDFCLAALFAVLAVEQWRNSRNLLPIAAAAAIYFIARNLWPAQALMLAIGVCVLGGFLWARGLPGSPRWRS